MNIARKSVALVVTSALLAAGLCARAKGDSPGQALDRGLTKTGDAVKDAGEAIKPK